MDSKMLLALGAILLGTTNARVAQAFTNPWGRDEEPFGHRLIANRCRYSDSGDARYFSSRSL